MLLLKDIGSCLELGFTQTDLDLWDEFSKDKLVVQRNKYLNLSFRRIMIDEVVHGIVLSIQDVTESRKLVQEEDCWMEMRSISGPITLERTRREWLDGFL